MATKSLRPTNGVSYGGSYTVASGDATVLFDFRTTGDDATDNNFRYDLVGIVQVLASGTKIVTMPNDLKVTYPYKGTVLVSGTLVAGSTINLIAQRDGV